MAAIERVLVDISRTTLYPGVLTEPPGRLATRAGYVEAFSRLDRHVQLPWAKDRNRHWTRFWSSYLGAPEALRSLVADAAWSRVVPFRWMGDVAITGPAGITASSTVLVHPGAISVVIRLHAVGSWTLDELPAVVAALRTRRDWTLRTPDGASAGRNLIGIASELRDLASGLLADGSAPQPGPATESSVAAPIAASGDLAEFDVTQPAAASCMVGLAALAPGGQFDEGRLLRNNNPRYGALVYPFSTGHAIWHPRWMVEQPAQNPIGCLHRNHVDLTTQVNALVATVVWAGERIDANVPIDATQQLVRLAARQLRQLHAGSARTYKSGIAKVRIEPILATLSRVESMLGPA